MRCPFRDNPPERERWSCYTALVKEGAYLRVYAHDTAVGKGLAGSGATWQGVTLGVQLALYRIQIHPRQCH